MYFKIHLYYNLCTKLFLDDRKIRRSISRTFNYMQSMEVPMENYHKQKKRRKIDWLCIALSSPYDKQG